MANPSTIPMGGPVPGTPTAPQTISTTNNAAPQFNPQTGNNPVGSYTGQPGAGFVSTPPQTFAQQAASFQNQYTPAEQNLINAMPTQLAANYANTPQMVNSPLAGLTVLGSPAQAGLYTSGPTNINTAQSNPILAAQLQNVNQLNQQANGGPGTSLASLQAQQIGQQNIANQMALIGSQRGSANSALGLRNAQINAAQQNQGAVQAGVAGTLQEQYQAQQALAGALQGTQGQVMQGAQAQAQMNQQQQQFNAGQGNQANLQNAQFGNAAMLQQGSMNQQTSLANQQAQQQAALANLSSSQQTNLANLQAQQQTQGLDANEYNAMLQAQMALGNTNLTASENYANLVANQNTQLAGIAANLNIANSANQMGLAGAGIAGGAGVVAGGLSAFSDRNVKINIRPGTRAIKDFMRQLSA